LFARRFQIVVQTEIVETCRTLIGQDADQFALGLAQIIIRLDIEKAENFASEFQRGENRPFAHFGQRLVTQGNFGT